MYVCLGRWMMSRVCGRPGPFPPCRHIKPCLFPTHWKQIHPDNTPALSATPLTPHIPTGPAYLVSHTSHTSQSCQPHTHTPQPALPLPCIAISHTSPAHLVPGIWAHTPPTVPAGQWLPHKLQLTYNQPHLSSTSGVSLSRTYSRRACRSMATTRAEGLVTTREYHRGLPASSDSSPTVSPACRIHSTRDVCLGGWMGAGVGGSGSGVKRKF